MPKHRKAKSRGPLKSARYFIVIVTSMLAALASTMASMLLVATSTFTGAVSLAANWALAVPGTGNPTAVPNVNDNTSATFTNAEVRNFITPTNPACASGLNGPAPGCTQQAIDYDASFWPIILFGGLKQLTSAKWNTSVASGVTNLQDTLSADYQADPTGHFYLTGYSQGATVVSYFKNGYPLTTQGQAAENLPSTSQITLVMAANPQRPNGGLFERFGVLGLPIDIPILDATVGIPAKTDTGIKTTDIAIQYDGVSDFPEYPVNALADLNAIAGLFFIHPTYVDPNGPGVNSKGQPVGHPNGHPYGYSEADFTAAVAAAQQAADNGQCGNAANNCQVHGDTTYITLPTDKLPLLAPLYYEGEKNNIPALTALADLLNPDMKVLIETGYNRTDYGAPTNVGLIPIINPIALTASLVAGAFQGISNAVGDLNGTRPADPTIQDPFGTASELVSDPSGPPASFASPLALPTTNASTPKAPTANVLLTKASVTSNTASGSGTTTSGTSSSGTSTTTTGTNPTGTSSTAVVTTTAGTSESGTSTPKTGTSPTGTTTGTGVSGTSTTASGTAGTSGTGTGTGTNSSSSKTSGPSSSSGTKS